MLRYIRTIFLCFVTVPDEPPSSSPPAKHYGKDLAGFRQTEAQFIYVSESEQPPPKIVRAKNCFLHQRAQRFMGPGRFMRPRGNSLFDRGDQVHQWSLQLLYSWAAPLVIVSNSYFLS